MPGVNVRSAKSTASGSCAIEPSLMTFSIVNSDSGVTRVAMNGCLDVGVIGLFRRELSNLLRLHPALVEVDVSGLRLNDSPGLERLLSFFKDLSEQGAQIVLHGLRRHPRGRFDVVEVRSAPPSRSAN